MIMSLFLMLGSHYHDSCHDWNRGLQLGHNMVILIRELEHSHGKCFDKGKYFDS